MQTQIKEVNHDPCVNCLRVTSTGNSQSAQFLLKKFNTWLARKPLHIVGRYRRRQIHIQLRPVWTEYTHSKHYT